MKRYFYYDFVKVSFSLTWQIYREGNYDYFIMVNETSYCTNRIFYKDKK